MLIIVQLIWELAIDWVTLRTLMTFDSHFYERWRQKPAWGGLRREFKGKKWKLGIQTIDKQWVLEGTVAVFQGLRKDARFNHIRAYREHYGDCMKDQVVKDDLGSLDFLWWVMWSGIKGVMHLALIVFKGDCDAKLMNVGGIKKGWVFGQHHLEL